MPARLRTDWDRYYAGPAPTALITRRFTERLLIRLLAKHTEPAGALRVCELGGANSCFLAAILARLPVSGYHVIDNNARGLALLGAQREADARLTWSAQDVLQIDAPSRDFDVVFSVGLIEHFDPSEAARAIAAHFALARPGGIVLISFPTSTWLYRLSRSVLERMGLWSFPDERALDFAEVIASVAPRGSVLHQSVNWPVILTQGIVVARVNRDPD